MKKITLFLFALIMSWQINAQCDAGLSSVNITTSGGGYASEKWVSISTEPNGIGNIVWSQGNGTYGNGAGLINIDICLDPGTYYINCYDKYADTWDGTKYAVTSYGIILANNANLSPTSGDSEDVNGDWSTPELELESSEMFTVSAPPSCLIPSALTTNAVTSMSATISWQAPASVPASGYEFYYSESNVAPIASGTPEASTSANLTGLDGEETYYFWVRSICAVGNESSWVGPIAFYTGHCLPSSTASGTYINSFSTTGGISNVSNLSSGYTTGGYQNNYATGTVTSYAEGSVDFSSIMVGGSAGTAIWIDWNKDFIFSDATEKVFTTSSYGYDQSGTITIPAGTALGDYRMRVRVDYNDSTPDACSSSSTRTEAEDYKFTVVAQPTDDVDFANIQAFVVGNEAVSTMQDCQTVDVYAQAWQEGSTDAPGQAAGLLAWIGYSTENTDPATWPESAFTAAFYNTDSGSNDEFKVSYSDLPEGTYYFASRFQLNFGPYRYGADGNFWNGTTVTNKVFTVATPVIVVSASEGAICSGESTTLSVTSENENYTYDWDNSLGAGETFEVSPTSGTTYTVIATDSETGCTVTSSVTVTVNALPPAVNLNVESATICDGETLELVATGGNLERTVVSGTGTLTTIGDATSSALGPNPLQNYYGGAKQQWLYTASELASLGFSEGTEILAIKLDLATANETYALENLSIKMKLSEAISFVSSTAWESGMQTVKALASYTPVVGLNNFTLDQNFVWDGTSSLVIEMNYSNNNGGSSGTKNTAKYSATTFPSTLFYRVDSDTPAEVDSYIGVASFIQNFRSDVSFDYVIPTTTQWTPVEGLYTDAEATVAYVQGASVEIVYAKPAGNMTYQVVSSTASCPSVATEVAITVNAIITPDFAAIAPICAGDDAPILELTSPNGVAGTWNPATVDTANSGSYVFTPNAGQCALTQTLTVAVNELPSLIINDPAPVCASGTVDITATEITEGSSIDITLSYWADPAGTVSFPDPSAITSSGTFFIRAENASGCSVILPVTVEVKEAVDAPSTTTPIQDFTTGDDLSTFEVTGENLIWYNAETEGSELPSTTVITTGTVYYVSQTVDGCESADRLMVTAGEDLKAPGFDKLSLKYYPNPVSDILIITYSNAIESVEIFNVLGQKVYQKAHNNQEVKIDMSSLATGNYIVKVMSKGLVENLKVIKK